MLVERMVACESVCLRRLAGGRRGGIVGFGRFLANERVTADAVIESWGTAASKACAGRHVLAIQDLSEIAFRTRPEDQRGLGEIGKGNSRGVLLHAMLAVDAEDGACLGLVSGEVWTRAGRVSVPHARRPLAQKESQRWLSTAETAKRVLARAATVTVVADRESDIYGEWARLPEPGFHLLTRAMHDRALEGGGLLSTAPLQAGGDAVIDVRARPGRPARQATLRLRFGEVAIKRPANTLEPGLPGSVTLSLVEVCEMNAPPGAEPIVWRLLTTHRVADASMAWQIVAWYRQRWTIEQLFRTLKQQGLQIEDSQLGDAGRLVKLTAIATLAACVVMQLVHARDGRSGQSADLVFTPPEIATLHTLVPRLEGATAAQKNPHPPASLAWAAWAIAKLGGWDGYAASKPPGPITFKHGLQRFKSIAFGHALQNV